MSFARKISKKYGKKLKDTETKMGIDATKTASKRVVQKTAEAIGDLTGNKIADKINSVGKTKSKEKIYVPTSRKNAANNKWFKIVLTPYKKWNTKKLQTC